MMTIKSLCLRYRIIAGFIRNYLATTTADADRKTGRLGIAPYHIIHAAFDVVSIVSDAVRC